MIYFAHRGASHYAPENTAGAFELALEMGAKAVELDVHLTADGVVAVHHDYELKRTAGAKARIEDEVFEELKKYNLAKHFRRWKTAEHLLSLEEAFRILGSKTLVNVEIKNDGGIYPSMEPAVLHVCRRRFRKTLFSSFDHETLLRLRMLEPKARLGVLVNASDFNAAFDTAAAVKAESLHLALRKLDARISHTAHELGLKVYVYTVDTLAGASIAQALGADGIFTNRPDLEKEMKEFG